MWLKDEAWEIFYRLKEGKGTEHEGEKCKELLMCRGKKENRGKLSIWNEKGMWIFVPNYVKHCTTAMLFLDSIITLFSELFWTWYRSSLSFTIFSCSPPLLLHLTALDTKQHKLLETLICYWGPTAAPWIHQHVKMSGLRLVWAYCLWQFWSL